MNVPPPLTLMDVHGSGNDSKVCNIDRSQTGVNSPTVLPSPWIVAPASFMTVTGVLFPNAAIPDPVKLLYPLSFLEIPWIVPPAIFVTVPPALNTIPFSPDITPALVMLTPLAETRTPCVKAPVVGAGAVSGFRPFGRLKRLKCRLPCCEPGRCFPWHRGLCPQSRCIVERCGQPLQS
jgi:hypothetical protein